MKHVVIIGCGITGLAAAHRLLELTSETRTPVKLTLLEASSRVGGIVQTRMREGFLLECGPDSFISEKRAALQLAMRLGLEPNLIETNEGFRRSFVVRQGRLLPVPDGFQLLAPARLQSFFKSDIFSWPGKARMALDLILPRRGRNGGDHNDADESLAHFVRRRLGQEALERMAQPMVGGIYTADPEKLSLRATVPRFLEMEREHRSVILALRRKNLSPQIGEGTSGARYSLFLSFAGGMRVLTDKLAEQISDSKFQIPNIQSQSSEARGTNSEAEGTMRETIRLNTAVESLELEQTEPAGGKSRRWKIKTSNNETILADAVCLALPGYLSARLLRNVDAQLAAELEAIPYASSATINLAYKREDIPHPLDGFGFVVPFIEKRTVMACTFSSVKFAGRAPQGHALLRAFVGGALQPELLEMDEAELLARVREDLRQLLGIERAPLFAEVARWLRSMPQYHVGHLARVQRIEQRLASLPNLALAGNAYSGLGIPDCIRSGEAAAEVLTRIVADKTRIRGKKEFKEF
jgi:oxygen-dependent protoporphyrinogen oxidase